jgi:Holliday junction resolvase
MGPEAKLYQKLKRNLKSISLIRIENNSLLGTPDLLGYNNSGHFFTIELKVTKSNKVRFSPHQIAFHVRHPKNTFIIIQHLGQGTVKLFRGSRILELEACGFKLEACRLGLDACRLELEACGL